jgi:urease accessory protein
MIMINISSVIGNIFRDGELQKLEFEKIKISRIELEKRILRRRTDKGTDVGITLDTGFHLHNGDVIGNDETKILIEQIPEKVISIKLKKNSQNLATLLGHIIGNRHRPIGFEDGAVLFPIQADSELEVFERLFKEIIEDIELEIEEKLFLPHTSADVHEH